MDESSLTEFETWLLRQLRLYGPTVESELIEEAEIHGEGRLVGPAVKELERRELVKFTDDGWEPIFRTVEEKPAEEKPVKVEKSKELQKGFAFSE